MKLVPLYDHPCMGVATEGEKAMKMSRFSTESVVTSFNVARQVFPLSIAVRCAAEPRLWFLRRPLLPGSCCCFVVALLGQALHALGNRSDDTALRALLGGGSLHTPQYLYTELDRCASCMRRAVGSQVGCNSG